jgi:predicted neuraminidase
VLALHAYFAFSPTERFPSCHGSTIVALPNGDLLAACYAGAREKATDVAILCARKPLDREWQAPAVVADTPGKAEGNPVLFLSEEGDVWLFYQTMHGSGEGPTQPGTGWTTCDIKRKRSADAGRTWGADEVIVSELGYCSRSKPLMLPNGDILLPIHDERRWSSLMLVSTDNGFAWRFSQEIDVGSGFEKGNIEPTVLLRKDGSVLCYMRSGARLGIWQSVSMDGGWTWSPPELTGLPNADAAVELLGLQSGHALLAFNNTSDGRTPLTLALSKDDAHSWFALRDAETDPGEYSYPALIQAANASIHMTYTYRRTHIRHIEFDEEWLVGGGQ